MLVSVMMQVKFSEGPRNACPKSHGSLRWLLRQLWNDGQMAAWQESYLI
jgi:hypothetical protein